MLLKNTYIVTADTQERCDSNIVHPSQPDSSRNSFKQKFSDTNVPLCTKCQARLNKSLSHSQPKNSILKKS